MKYILITMFLSVSGILKSQQFEWVKQLGGPTSDAPNSVAVDTAGNVYTTGFFQGTADLDPGIGTYTLTSFGSSDIFISKLDKYGNFIWAKQLGGTTNDAGNTITLDAFGNVYVTGNFSGTGDFDPGAAVFNMVSAGANDVFISKLNSNGNFIWAKRLGGSSSEYGYSIHIDQTGNIYTTGSFIGTADFDPGPAVATMTAAATSGDIFICKLDSTAGYVWAKQVGGNISDQGIDITTDSNGNNYTVGTFQQTADFNPGAGVYTVTATGQTDGFILKLDASGNFIWMKQIKGIDDENVYSIVLDRSNNIYTCGSFRGTVDFDPGPATYTFNCSDINDAYISKLDSSGNFLWARKFGGSNYDFCAAVSVDTLGNVYGTGYFSTTVDFDPGPATYNLVSTGGNDAFINKLDPYGNFIWAKKFGSTGDDQCKAIEVTHSGSIYTTGSFVSTVDFDPGPGVTTLTTSSFYVDVFVHKMNYCATASSLISPVVCNSYTSPSGKHTYTVSGVYTDSLHNALGCDSIFMIDLTVHRNTTHTISPVVCERFTSPSGNLYTAGGMYTDTIPNAAGCDSIITIHLTVKHNTTHTISPVVCDRFTAPSGNLYTSSGVYKDTISNSVGCDSIITINLIVNHNASYTISPSACRQYQSPAGNIYTSNGLYADTLSTVSGCDSIININLTINQVDTSVNVSSIPVLMANASSATFQWLDCNNGFSIIPGQTASNFTVTTNGNYAVQVTSNSCVDTSSCYVVNTTRIEPAGFLQNIMAYPNPTDKNFKIELDKLYDHIEVIVKNTMGAEVKRTSFVNTDAVMLEMEVPPGIYFVHLKANAAAIAVLKVIKTTNR